MDLDAVVIDVSQINDPQMWKDRRRKVKKLKFSDKALFDELLFTMKLLKKNDAYNKFAWSHRQWSLEALDTGYADEIGFCNILLKRDIKNRPVWDQRWFAVQKCLAKGWTIIKSCEVTILVNFIISYPECSYPWRFLRSLHKDDIGSLARNAHLQWALVCVFVQARKYANSVTADKMLYENKEHARVFESVNKRGCLFALDLVSDFLNLGYELDKEAEEAFKDVFKGYGGSTLSERVGSVLQKHRMEVIELCADFTKELSHSAGKMNTIRFSPFPNPLCISDGIPKRKRSRQEDDDDDGCVKKRKSTTSSPPSHPGYELCGQGGFSTICATLFPENPSLIEEVRERDKFIKEDRARKLLKRQKYLTAKFKHKKDDGRSSKMPEPLRSVYLGLIEHSDFDSDNHTRHLLFCEGHSNPTAWQVRRLVVLLGQKELQDEVNFLEFLRESSSYNPYYWHHRRWVSEQLGRRAAEKELEFTEKLLSRDADHYKAWSHRQWVCRVLKKNEWGKAEVAFCEKMIEKDSSNCYAWNERFFVSKEYPGMMPNDVEIAEEAILADPENEMPRMYLNCLDNLPKENIVKKKRLPKKLLTVASE